MQGNVKDLSDWELLFEYEDAVINYGTRIKLHTKHKASKKLELYRKEVIKRLGWGYEQIKTGL